MRLCLLALVVLPLLIGGCGAGDGSTEPDEGTVDSELRGENPKTAFDYFVGKGLKDFQAAAIVGNLQQESNVLPSAVQRGGPGRGIAQWSVGARWDVTRGDNLAWFARTHGGSVLSLNTQLDFIWFELETFPLYGLAALERSTTLNGAVAAFSKDFEACGNCNATRRNSYAKAALTAYGHESP